MRDGDKHGGVTEGLGERTSFYSPKCPILLIVGRAKASDALWKGNLEGSFKLAEFSVFLVVWFAPKNGSIVYEETRVGYARFALSGLVTSDCDDEGLCEDGFAVFFEFCGYDCCVWLVWGVGRVNGRDVLPSTRTGVRPR